MKDLRGHTLPATATTGEISWFTVDPDNGAGRVLVSNPESGLARNFSCGYNLVLCGIEMYGASALFGIDDYGFLGPLYSETCTAYAPTACSGGQYSTQDGGYSINWWSNSTSIAPLSGANYNPSASFFGQGTGTGTGTGEMYSASCQDQGQGTNTVTSQILLNGATISTQSPGSIVIGQQATLSLNTGSTSLNSASWGVGGTTVGSFSQGPAPPAANFNQKSPSFYWVPTYYGTSNLPASWTASVSVTGQLSNGTSTSASANVTVNAPSVKVTPTNGKDIWLYLQNVSAGAGCGKSVSGDTCMALSPSVGPANGVSGSTQWVQVINSISDSVTTSSGSHQTCSLPGATPALDTSYPYTAAALFTDSPRESYDVQQIDGFTTSSSYSTVLMWKPSATNPIWVPVSSTNWTWGATVTFTNDNWVLSSPSYPSAQVLYGGYWPVYNSTFISGSSSLTCH